MTTTQLHQEAREIFATALRAVDASEAVRRSVILSQETLRIQNVEIDVSNRTINVIALGKAATAMAAGLSDVLGDKLKRGIVSSITYDGAPALDGDRWQIFAGGHPLPTSDSIAAARASVRLLKGLEDDALVIFLVSGGGSAMFELPIDDRITIEDLREANRQLVSCGAAIGEINTVRRAFSAVKGGKLSAFAPHANQITLIVSDTNHGDEANVASGPTLEAVDDISAAKVVERYGLGRSLPKSILNAFGRSEAAQPEVVKKLKAHYVLLDNQTAQRAAAKKAQELGFAVEIAANINEQEIDAGCDWLVSRARAHWQSGARDKVCLISGGEFSCPVRGDGIGGRNLETVLRCSMKLNELQDALTNQHWAVLSAGTDGVDGNSRAAGAWADETTIARAKRSGLDPVDFLDRSDAFRFFEELRDLVITGPTGTNVRDVRIVLMDRAF
jgi:glycerate 2-kinase